MRHRRLGFALLFVLLVAFIVAGAFSARSIRLYLAPPATVAAARGTISSVVVATGRVEPLTEVVLANKIPGRVKSVLVKEGERVSVGQPIVLFDDDEFQTQVRVAETRVTTAQADVLRAQRAVDSARARWREVKSGARTQEIERARAELLQAKRSWENADRERTRARQLFERGLIAQAQYDAAATEADIRGAQTRGAEQALGLLLAGPKPEAVATAWAQVREAEAELRRIQAVVSQGESELLHARALLKTTVVESTVAGTVTYKLVEPGSAVDIGVPLMVLAESGMTLVRIEVDETDVGKLEMGQLAHIVADAYPGRIFPGRVIEIGQAIGKRKIRPDSPIKIQDMKVLEAKVQIDAAVELKLGMTVDVRIVAAHKENALVVPWAAVTGTGSRATVQIVNGRARESRPVRLGVHDDVNVEVVDGLSPGDRVGLADRRR